MVNREKGATVCAVDWRKLANFEYSISATFFLPKAASVVCQFIKYLLTQSFNADDITLIGHSLGGQMSGMIGSCLGGILGRIFGLDAAGPLFCLPKLLSLDQRLDPSDAKRVYAIHTTDGLLGCDQKCGHVDFYPDSGTFPQLGCLMPMAQAGPSPEMVSCSHSMACIYFLWSMYRENNMTATQCGNGYYYGLDLCKNNPTDVFGFYSTAPDGDYYLSLGSKAPSGIPDGSRILPLPISV